MFTVVFLSSAARSIYDSMEAYFAPFVASGEIAFCDWDEEATASRDVFPDLPGLIQGKPAWRAVVVDHAAATADPARDTENPFDYVENTDPALSLTASPHALVRMAHFLLGYPALAAKDFEPVVVHRDSRNPGGPPVRLSADLSLVIAQPGESAESIRSRALHVMVSELSKREADVRLEYVEQPHSAAQQAHHAALTAQVWMREDRPTEVAFICTRVPRESDDRAQLHRVWHNDPERASSRFVDRNDYPVSSRFAVFDLVGEEHSAYAQSLLKFWMSVLTVCTNQLPPSTFQADRVYELGVRVDDAALASLLTAHMSTLTALRTHVNSLLIRRDRPPEADVRDLSESETVTVEFERLDGSALRVSERGFGLATDYPRNESAAWSAEFGGVRQEAHRLVRKPRRVLSRAVFEARAKMRGFLGDQSPLSDIEREELEDELATEVRALAVPATSGILDRAALSAMLSTSQTSVARAISERMRIGTIGGAALVVGGAWAIALTPYLIQAANRDAEDPLIWSIFVTAAVILGLAAIAVIVLVLMRRRLINRIRDINAHLKGFVTRVETGAHEFGRYLSQLATYMRRRSALIGARNFDSEVHRQRRRLVMVRNDIDEVLDTERAVVRSLDRPVDVRRINLPLAVLDRVESGDVRSLFELPVSDHPVPLNESGDVIGAPYDFISAFFVERARLYERVTASVRGDGGGGLPA